MSITRKQSRKTEINKILQELGRKLLLLEGERKSAKRKELIDSMLDENGCDLARLKKLLNL